MSLLGKELSVMAASVFIIRLLRAHQLHRALPLLLRLWQMAAFVLPDQHSTRLLEGSSLICHLLQPPGCRTLGSDHKGG